MKPDATKNVMPVLFIGHGSPMNAIENNEFSSEWIKVAGSIPKPKAILCISAHWLADGNFVNNDQNPKTIYDFYGFPDELYNIAYKSPGAPDIAEKIISLTSNNTKIDNSWGIDHGTWSILNQMYPEANIPTTQLSINRLATAQEMFDIGQKIKSLRQEGVLIIGSGNIVHNLYEINWGMKNTGYIWAAEFNKTIKKYVIDSEYNKILNFKNLGKIADLSVPTAEHFLPLIYILGSTNKTDSVHVFNEKLVMGSLSMTCYLFS